jgi:guanosine-3',5'-bis(diphosphate) 3'-pyrophosphohydrolase
MWNQDLYQKALGFAGYAHRDQLVPGKEYNYVVHICNVAAEVMRSSVSENIEKIDIAVQCALLHDVLEDTDTSEESVLNEFGIEVLNGVKALTKDSSLEKEYQMNDSLKRIKLIGKEIGCVKLADRITNLQKPPPKWDKEKRLKYLNEAKLILSELSGYSGYLSRRLAEKIIKFEKDYI